MLKKERLQWILRKVDKQGIISVNEVIDELGVSDMTVRRDLDELDRDNLLIRIHGGAQAIEKYDDDQAITNMAPLETSPQSDEKKEIAKFTQQCIKDGETIFLGGGTTLTYLATELVNRNIRVVTNNLPAFMVLKDRKNIDLILTGGEYRNLSGTFVGSLATNYLQSIKFSKTFISAKGIFNDTLTTYNESEGELQRIALDNARQTFLLIDSSKFDKYDFYDFYNTSQINYVITDSNLSDEVKQSYQNYANFMPIK